MKELIELLESVGISTSPSRDVLNRASFPLSLPLNDGSVLRLELSEPPLISSLDPEMVGAAVLDPIGRVVANWGLAGRVPHLKKDRNVLETPLKAFLDSTDDEVGSSLFLDGYRYVFANLGPGMGAMKLILVVSAREESLIRKESAHNRRAADALRRLGNTLSMHQSRVPLCFAATHEIASALELSAVLLWTVDPLEQHLDLTASVGANRQAGQTLRKLNAVAGASCAAEVVAATRQAFYQESVADNGITGELEAKFCYLRPGGVAVHPLEISGKLLGVLELIGREGDSFFAQSRELFQTVAEHLALAIHSADLFENLERLASHDPLTGLANHRYMQDFLHQRLHEAERTNQSLGLLMVDVDHFRAFNEEEGHDTGDAVLRLVGETLKSCIRQYDVAARYGGEEFVLVMPGSDMTTTAAVGERLRRRIETRPFNTKAGREAHITVSVGCASFPESASDSSGLLKAADLALYEAKHAGRNRVVRYSGSQEEPSQRYRVAIQTVQPWVSKAEWDDGIARCDRRSADVDLLSRTLSFSESQRELIRALLIMAPVFLGWLEKEPEAAKEYEASEEGRVLLPSLQNLTERYDGGSGRGTEGKKIPLLSRVLRVILAIDDGETLHEDDGRFDPDIVSLLEPLHRAA